jgi:hypothetical protein
MPASQHPLVKRLVLFRLVRVKGVVARRWRVRRVHGRALRRGAAQPRRLLALHLELLGLALALLCRLELLVAGNDFLDPLLVTLHLEKSPNLVDGQVLAVPERHNLVKGAQQVVGVVEDAALVDALARARHDLRKEVQQVNVLEDVGLPVGDEHHVKLVEGLVDEADVVLLHRCVLRAAVGEFGKRRQQGLDPGPRHLAKLS